MKMKGVFDREFYYGLISLAGGLLFILLLILLVFGKEISNILSTAKW